jgi:regulator of protease activity HflC (stomatin/prohibitin superfamily)
VAFFVLTAIFVILGAIGVVYGKSTATAGRDTADTGKINQGRLIVVGSIVAAAVLLVGFVLIRAIHSVENGHIGLVKQFGDIVGTKSPGVVIIAPWQSISDVSVRIQSKTFTMDDERAPGSGSAVTRDNQQLFATVTLNFQVDARHAVPLYKSTGGRYIEILVNPRVPQAFKAVTARFRATKIASNRELLRKLTQQKLDSQLDRDGIHVTDFLIENVHFSPEFQKALEDTQVAAQRAKQEQQRVLIEEAKARQREAKARGIANANVIEAQGQAKANKLIGESLNDRVIHFLSVQKLAPGIKSLILPAGSNFILPASITGETQNGGGTGGK